MTKIKLCGLRRSCDIAYANELVPEYIGFVFAKKSKRYVSPAQAEALGKQLNAAIVPVGVFVDEEIEEIAALVRRHIIDAIQLHGNEDAAYISALRGVVTCPIIQAFRIESRQNILAAGRSPADIVLLDSGNGSGKAFDWTLLKEIQRPYFLAGGLTPENVQPAISRLRPFGVDASSSLETDGYKDKEKMTAFVNAVRQRKD